MEEVAVVETTTPSTTSTRARTATSLKVATVVEAAVAAGTTTSLVAATTGADQEITREAEEAMEEEMVAISSIIPLTTSLRRALLVTMPHLAAAKEGLAISRLMEVEGPVLRSRLGQPTRSLPII